MREKTLNLIFYSVFLLAIIIGAILFINRYVIVNFLPNNSFRILADHFVAGFLTPLCFFIVYLGIGSFFHPNRKISYSIKWFVIYTCLALLMPIIWEGIIQHFNDVGQISSELLGICCSWIYFLWFRNLKRKQLVNLS